MTWQWPRIWIGESGGWWRVPICYLAFGGFFFLVGSILANVFGWDGRTDTSLRDTTNIFIDVGLDYFLRFLPLYLSCIGIMVAVRLVHRKSPFYIVTDGRSFDFALFLKSAILWSILWLIGVVGFPGGIDELRLAFQFRLSSAGDWLPFVLITTPLVLLQSAAEEVVDRGYLQVRIAAWVNRSWLAVGMSTIVFTFLHTGQMTVWAYVRIALLGVALGVALIRANTVAPLIAVHGMNNLLDLLFLPLRSNSNANLLEAIYLAIQLTLWLVWLFWTTRNRQTVGASAIRNSPTLRL